MYFNNIFYKYSLLSIVSHKLSLSLKYHWLYSWKRNENLYVVRTLCEYDHNALKYLNCNVEEYNIKNILQLWFYHHSSLLYDFAHACQEYVSGKKIHTKYSSFILFTVKHYGWKCSIKMIFLLLYIFFVCWNWDKHL